MRRKRALRPNATQEAFWKNKTDESKSKTVNSISHRSNVTLIFRFTVIRYCYLNTGKTSFSPQYVGLGFARRCTTIVLNCRPVKKINKKKPATCFVPFPRHNGSKRYLSARDKCLTKVYSVQFHPVPAKRNNKIIESTSVQRFCRCCYCLFCS